MLRGLVVLLFVVLVVSLTVACGRNCPTASSDGWNVGSELERKIWDAVAVKLNDPSSYRPVSYYNRGTQQRKDSEDRYVSRVEVRFTAANAFGGRVQNTALVTLREPSNGKGCDITRVQLSR